MNDLSADARALIAQTKTLDDPSAADRARVRQKLAGAWAAQNAAAGTRSKFEDDVISPGKDSRWLWATLTTTALSMVIGLWFMMHPQRLPTTEQSALPALHPATEQSSPADARDDTNSEPNLAPSTLQEQNSPALIARKSKAAFARDPETASEPQLTEPMRRPSKARPQANARTRKPTPATSDETALDDIVDPEPAPQTIVQAKPRPELSAPQPTAASDSAQRSRAPATTRDADREPAARDSATAARVRANGNSKGVDGDDIAPPQTGPKFVAQPIDDELALLGAAQEALRNQQPSLALRLVQHHGFRFPRGALAQERVAVQTLALCALHRPAEARQVLAELARRAPNSPLVDKLRSSCGFEAGEGSGH